MDLGPFPQADGYVEAVDLDRSDQLSGFREKFHFADPDLIYLDGNSLGRMPLAARSVLDQAQRAWGERLIRSWNEGWWDLQIALGDRVAPLIGASPGEVIISDSTTVNLYKLAMAALEPSQGRRKVVTDDANFPTDIYVLRGAAEAMGGTLEVVASEVSDDPVAAMEAAVDDETALVSLSQTAFKTGYTYDLAVVTEIAHRHGARVLWDLSHSVGVMPIDLNRSRVDLAVGCTYKYLNGGPGSPAFLFVRRDLQDLLQNPIQGWWGHSRPFAFDLEFRPAAGIRRFHTGTMPILSLAAIEAGIESVAGAGIDRIRAKSVSLTEFFVKQSEGHLAQLGFELGSPRDASTRGSHLSLSHPEAWTIDQALIELGKVIPDFRAPDNLRFGLSPLYNTHLEVHTAVQRLRVIVQNGLHHGFEGREATVT